MNKWCAHHPQGILRYEQMVCTSPSGNPSIRTNGVYITFRESFDMNKNWSVCTSPSGILRYEQMMCTSPSGILRYEQIVCTSPWGNPSIWTNGVYITLGESFRYEQMVCTSPSENPSIWTNGAYITVRESFDMNKWCVDHHRGILRYEQMVCPSFSGNLSIWTNGACTHHLFISKDSPRVMYAPFVHIEGFPESDIHTICSYRRIPREWCTHH